MREGFRSVFSLPPISGYTAQLLAHSCESLQCFVFLLGHNMFISDYVVANKYTSADFYMSGWSPYITMCVFGDTACPYVGQICRSDGSVAYFVGHLSAGSFSAFTSY